MTERPWREPAALLAVTCAVLVWSGISPADRLVWAMEVAPVVLGGAALALAWKRFPFTPLVYRFAAFFGLILMLGGKYTYELVPVGEWFQQALGTGRNHFDRFGHFFQGVIPALFARELYLRCTSLRPGKALFWSCVCVALSISAGYELFEWWTTLLVNPDAGIAFLGAQGDVWDAQKDMLMATCGSMLVQLLFGRAHDRQIGGLYSP